MIDCHVCVSMTERSIQQCLLREDDLVQVNDLAVLLLGLFHIRDQLYLLFMIRVCFIASYGLQFSDGLEGDVVLQVDAPESCGTQFFEEELLLKYFTALFE